MKRLLITALIALAVVACSKETQTSTAGASKEKTYPMMATIVSRDSAKNTVNLDNKEVPGEMAAMKMDFELRGVKVTRGRRFDPDQLHQNPKEKSEGRNQKAEIRRQKSEGRNQKAEIRSAFSCQRVSRY